MRWTVLFPSWQNQRINCKFVSPAGAVLPRHFAPQLHEAFNTVIVSTESIGFVPTGVSLQFDCETPRVAFVDHRGLIMHQNGNSRVDTRVVVERACVWSSTTVGEKERAKYEKAK
ncbi:MAG: hypothetical protein ACPG8W_09025 [Candidatus Promineifilaceae bacterium]